MGEQIRERARTLIAGFKDRGGCDFINDFSEKFPIAIVLDLLGLPTERMAQLLYNLGEGLQDSGWDGSARSEAVSVCLQG